MTGPERRHIRLVFLTELLPEQTESVHTAFLREAVFDSLPVRTRWRDESRNRDQDRFWRKLEVGYHGRDQI